MSQTLVIFILYKLKTTMDPKNLNAYEKANRWIAPIPRDENGYLPGLYFWGSKNENWQMYTESGNQHEYKIDSFRCTDPWIAIRLIAMGYALIESPIDNPSDGEKVVMLLMKRIY